MAAFQAPNSDKLFSSNPQHGLASNFIVSTRRKIVGFALLSGCLFAAPWGSAAQLKPSPALLKPARQELSSQALRPATKPNPVRSASADDSIHTFDRLGPQATARAVRASLRVALVPDPLCMGALLFCAFALRWMRMRKEDTLQPARAIATNPALPGAA